MLLGKRPRPPMKRTTSLNEFSFDLNVAAEAPPSSDPHNPFSPPVTGAGGQLMQGSDQRSLSSLVSPRIHRRHSADFVETSQFLRCCSLCKRRLVSGRDIYMYRGDSAFCSLECRQQQMSHDEKKEKCSLLASRKEVKSSAKSSQVSAAGEKVAAV